jgi:hypothetical protein
MSELRGVGSSRARHATKSLNSFDLSGSSHRSGSPSICTGRLPSHAVGVGNSGDEHAVAAVRGAKGGSRKAIPLRVIPARGQPSENFAEQFSSLESKESCDVLHDDIAGS